MKIQKFIDRLAINKQYAKSTIDSYTRILKSFDKYVKSLSLWKRWIEDTNQLKLSDVESFISIEKIKGKKARTCNLYLACVRDFIFYAEREWEEVFSYKMIVLMKEERKKIDALTESEAQKLLDYMKSDNSKDELTKTRDYAMVSILIYTWLRVSELCNIKVDDVKEELQVIGKNKTLRLVYLFQEHLALIRLYLFLRQGQNIESEYLFCSHSNNWKWKKLSRVSIETIVRTAGINAWISDPVRPHKLRHTFATSLLRRWWSLYYIKELLGHKHITTTQTYLTATNEDLKRTQLLLRGVEECVEELDNGDNYQTKKVQIITDQFKQIWDSLKIQWFGRGVTNYLWY